MVDAAIALLFFLYGARISPKDAWEGARNLRLHALVLLFTYLVFPLLGLLTQLLVPSLLTPELYVGVVFLCCLPSTVQSSIAFTSIARGNVAAALCAASLSNLLGVILAPLLVGLLLSKQGMTFSTSAIQKLFLQLLLPFFLGQLLRPRMLGFVTRHKQRARLRRSWLHLARRVRRLQRRRGRGHLAAHLERTAGHCCSCSRRCCSRSCWRSPRWPVDASASVDRRRDHHRDVRLQKEPRQRRADRHRAVSRRPPSASRCCR